jgi:hypothetical protein
LLGPARNRLFPPSLDEWLPERHLAQFVVEVIEGLDLSAMVKSYRGAGRPAIIQRYCLGLLVYGIGADPCPSKRNATES